MDTTGHVQQHAERPPQLGKPDWFSCWRTGFLYYYFTSMLVVLAVVIGADLLQPAQHAHAKQNGALQAFANWDGQWYRKIVTRGYAYDPDRPSSVAFFPAYPLLAGGLSRLTGLDPVLALLVVSHGCLLAAFAVSLAYVRLRYGNDKPNCGEYVVLSLALCPTAFFFRVAYSESLFVLLLVLCLYGMERRWPLLVLALLVGLATAARPVGPALVPPLLLHLRHRSNSARQFGFRLAWLLPLSLWGIAAYAGYLWFAFDEPLAFFKTQANWRVYRPASVAEKAIALLTFKPIWSIFDPSSPGYWLRRTFYPNPFASLAVMNPLYFIAGVVLIVLGLRRRWLSSYETLLAAGLLLIPYVASSYEMHAAGMARFVVTIFPLHLVAGQILARLRGPLAALVLSVSACLLVLYAALFAAWYQFF